MTRTVSSASLAIEQIQLRLNTITELGDVVVTLNPAMYVIKGIRDGFLQIQEADRSFSQISDILAKIIVESEQAPITEMNGLNGLNEDSTRIVEDDNVTVKRHVKNMFPNFPDTNLVIKRTEASARENRCIYQLTIIFFELLFLFLILSDNCNLFLYTI
jgi:division protein CdvB (Snf7/Vps24/ESCRT-III family)